MSDNDDAPQLVIQTDSWHYRYFVFIRNFWGMSATPTRTSLCPYCQTIFWFSFFALLLSPVIVLGWIMLKAFRIAYKGLDAMGFDWCIDIIDKTPLGDFASYTEEKVPAAPAPMMLLTTALFLFSLAFIGLIGFCVFWAILNFIMSIPAIPGAFVLLLTYIGYGLYHAFYGIGLALGEVVDVVRWLGLFLWDLRDPILYWFLVGLSIAVSGMALGYLSLAFSQTALAQKLWDILIFRLNGYGEARAKAKARRNAMEAASTAAVPVPKKPCWVMAMLKRIFCRDIDIGGKVRRVLTPFGILITWIIALKRNACPLIEFVEDDENK